MFRNKKPSVTCDDFAWKLLSITLEDLKKSVSESFFEAVCPLIRDRNVKAYRSLSLSMEGKTVTQLKAEYQIIDMFKKYVFSKDAQTPAETLEQSKKKFLDNQVRLNTLTFDLPSDTKNVLWLARGHCERILGDYNHLGVLDRASFGKKSSVGIPQRVACEAARYEGPISGSQSHVIWFDKLYSSWNRPAYLYAQSISPSGKVEYDVVDCLEASLVNKTWKSKRLILPNTTLGTLYSSGLGNYLTDRLREAGYDIRTLQHVHRDLARFGSINREIVTADQSLASDNIVAELVHWILPGKWADACELGRISKIGFYGTVLESKTFMTMGIGFTFPLQTLIFLSLLLGIRDHLNLSEDSVISVFGDDLIYVSAMHDLVKIMFPQLGLVINEAKTFSNCNFRESCGGDYYHGFDVRPFHLKESCNAANMAEFEAYLYKCINGLMARWQLDEIPQTLSFVYESLKQLKGSLPFRVPFDYPDTAGVKRKYPFPMAEIRRNKHGVSKFKYLAFKPDTRTETRHAPYFFLSLRRRQVVNYEIIFALTKLGRFRSSHGTLFDDSVTPFQEEPDHLRGYYFSKSEKRYKPHFRTLIPKLEKGRYLERHGTTSYDVFQ